MCRFSSKSSLLAGVSAVVLAASVGSGAFAQTAVDYTHSTGNNIWADGTARNANNTSSTDMAEARDGDNLTLSVGRVSITSSSRSGVSIGQLRSGASGAGKISMYGTDRTIGRISKQGNRAVDLLVDGSVGNSTLTVDGGAVVRNLSIFARYSVPNRDAKAIFGSDLTIEGGVNLADHSTAGNGRAYLVFNGSSDQRILGTGTAKIIADADGDGTIQVLNGRDGLAPRKATFDIEIGHDAATDANDRRLKQLTVGDASKGGHAIFNRGVHVDHINVIAGNHDNEDTVVEFRGNVSGDTIKLTSTSSGQDLYGPTAVFNASTSDITVDNEIVGGDDHGGMVRIIGGRSGSGQRKVTFNGKLGSGGSNPLHRVYVGRNGTGVAENDKSAGEAIFKEDVDSRRFEVNGGNAANEHSHATVEKNLTSRVTLADNAGSATLTIGGAGRLATVNDAGQTISGFIEAGGDGQGTLIVDNRGDAGTGRTSNNKVTFSQSVGLDGEALRQITLSDGRTTFSSDVYARSITIDTGDATVFKGHVKAGAWIHLGATSGSVTFNGTTGQTVAGKITTATSDRGWITVANKAGVTFEDDLGTSTAWLRLLTLTGHATAADASKATFKGNVYLRTGANGGLVLGQNTGVTFNGTDSQTVAGNITSASGGNYGTITIDNDDGVTFKGALGASGTNNGLDRLTLSDNSEATFESHVYLANGLTLGNSTITFGGSGNQTIKADIRNSTGKRGSVVVNNSGGTVTFEDAVGATGIGNDLALITLSDGVARFKGDVYAQSVGVSSTDGAEFRGNVTTGAVGILFAVNDDAKITLNGTANQTVTGDITPDFDGRGRLVVNNAGATNSNKVTFGGSVGADGTALKQITLSNGRTTFHSGVYADTINITTTDATVFKGHVKAETGIKLGNNSGSVTFSGTSGQTVTGNITTDANNQGSITVNNSVTFAGQIGTGGNNGKALGTLTLRDGLTTFGGDVYAQNIGVHSDDGTLFRGDVTAALSFGGDDIEITFGGAGDQRVANAIALGTGQNNRGLIRVNNSGGTVTFANVVGASGGAVKQITLDDGQTVFAGAVYAGTIDVNAGSDGTSFNSSVTTRAGLTLAGAATFKGSVTTGANGLVFDGARGSATFAGTAAQTITPAITTDANNRGAITIANRAGVTFEGNLGTTNARLARLTLHTGTKATLEQSGYFAGNVTLRNNATLIVGDASGVTGGTNGRGTGATAAQTITGNIVAGDDGQGNLEIRNRSSHATGQKVSFTGSIGTAEAALNRITVAGGETTFDGNVYAGNLNITASDATTFRGNVTAGTQFTLGDGSSVTFGGNAGQTITGDITSASGGDYGAIIIANTSDEGVTFEGALGASGANNGLHSLTVNEDAKVTFNQPVYLSGDLTAHRKSTLTLGPAFGERTGDAADQAFITVGGNFNLGTADADNSVRIAFDSSFTEGEQKLINKDLSAAIDNGKLILVESNVLKYELATDDGGSVIARAKGFKSAGEVSSKLGVSPSEATVLLAASSLAKDLPASDPVKKILQEAAQAGNEAKGKRLAAQLTPQMTALGGATAAVVSTGTQVAGVLSERLSVQRGGDSQSGFVQSGFATGGEGLDRAFWLKPFGSRGKQAKDKKQRIDGYDTSARGLAVGVDAPVGERGRVGTALAYSTSRMTGKGVGEDKTDVRSWQVSVYGDYSTGRYYVDGQVGVGRNDVSTTSRVAGLRRKSAYDTTSLTASVGGGVPINLDASTTLTPTAGLSWTRVGSAKYTTTGALSLNQKITVGSIDAVVGTLGTRLHKEITRGNGTLVPVARVGLSYDFAGEQTTARGLFTGGGSRFTVKGAKVRKLSGTAGVGLSYNAPRWSIGADYDLSARPGYTGHSARLNARVKF